jgi:hypothetical protein
VGAAELLSVVNQLLKPDQLAGRVARIGISSVLIILPLWNARLDLRLAIRNGYTTFIRDNHIYPVFAPDKAIRDARKIINRVEENAIVFADWDKLYSYIYTAHIEEGKTGISFHEAWIGDEQVLSETAIQYIDANIDDRPIYFAIDMPGLTDHYQVKRINDMLYRIYRK